MQLNDNKPNALPKSSVVFKTGDIVRYTKRKHNLNDEFITIGKVYEVKEVVEPIETGDLIINGRCFSRDRFELLCSVKDTKRVP